MSITRLGVCTLNQWAMDFSQNVQNIIESIEICKRKQCLYRLGPELEICGYMCEDHFLESDTVTHCWEAIVEILPHTVNIVCDIGMPVIHKSVFYNCRVILLNKKIHLVRPKMYLADDGNYRESRYFTPWSKEIEDLELPPIIQIATGQKCVPIGVAILQTHDTEIGIEICEEMWTPIPTSANQALDGAEIILNSSGSHYEVGKIKERTELFKDITKRNGACYAFCNLRGCDGNRLYFDGCSCIVLNGKVFAKSDAFSLKDVEVTTCDIDLQEVRNIRINIKSRSLMASKQKHFPRVKLDINLTQQQNYVYYHDIPIQYESEIEDSIACYLWDYMRRSGACGFMLPLSGGLDSSATALSVFFMANKIFKTINNVDNDHQTHLKVLQQLRKTVEDDTFTPKSPQEIVNRLFFTVYLGSENSTQDSRARSRLLAEQIGSKHYEVEIDQVCKACTSCIKPILKKDPQFIVNGGSLSEDLALQNIQARSRMILTYLLAQLTPWNNGKKGFLIVLGSSNLDESIRGFLTKYDCSSADINPIGSLSKNDLRELLLFCYKTFNFSAIQLILEAKPSPELRPQSAEGHVSENDMELTFNELETFAKLRKVQKLGPVSMFKKLRYLWSNMTPQQVAEKVKKFFKYYALNRHKVVTITASFHAQAFSQDDNRFDFRQFLYNWRWPWQFKKIDENLQ
ncbi:unnamed protein product [Paramecium primaurelia]|uniref:Glutamine-dependent NAD(+) synthetase n=1 Tax=Paramecium primaurelia TaxID=5886 RepID=A0A8S1JW13_PARPR|nr:unnamed protein product [Paramecium primaurelia]